MAAFLEIWGDIGGNSVMLEKSSQYDKGGHNWAKQDDQKGKDKPPQSQNSIEVRCNERTLAISGKIRNMEVWQHHGCGSTVAPTPTHAGP